MHDSHGDPGHGGHASADASHGAESHDKVYVRTIVVLTILTVAEFALVLGGKGTLPSLVIIGGLLFMAGWKALLVGKMFMHLKYDPRILAWIAITPLVLATPLYLIASYDFIHGMQF